MGRRALKGTIREKERVIVNIPKYLGDILQVLSDINATDKSAIFQEILQYYIHNANLGEAANELIAQIERRHIRRVKKKNRYYPHNWEKIKDIVLADENLKEEYQEAKDDEIEFEEFCDRVELEHFGEEEEDLDEDAEDEDLDEDPK